jgi:hypothetical protein
MYFTNVDAKEKSWILGWLVQRKTNAQTNWKDACYCFTGKLAHAERITNDRKKCLTGTQLYSNRSTKAKKRCLRGIKTQTQTEAQTKWKSVWGEPSDVNWTVLFHWLKILSGFCCCLCYDFDFDFIFVFTGSDFFHDLVCPGFKTFFAINRVFS